VPAWIPGLWLTWQGCAPGFRTQLESLRPVAAAGGHGVWRVAPRAPQWKVDVAKQVAMSRGVGLGMRGGHKCTSRVQTKGEGAQVATRA